MIDLEVFQYIELLFSANLWVPSHVFDSSLKVVRTVNSMLFHPTPGVNTAQRRDMPRCS